MPGNYGLGSHFDTFVQGQVEGGRYKDQDEVIRDALRLLKAREGRLAAFDDAVRRGLADADAGHVKDCEDVFDQLEDKYGRMAENSGRL